MDLSIIDSIKVFTENKNITIWNLRDMVDENDLILNPDYQREYVYDDIKASKLVESILLGLPIPEVYLCEESDGSYSTIDGQQRITSLVRFSKNEFKLRKLVILSGLNGLMFKDLDKVLQRKFKTSTIQATCLQKESGDLKYEIFSRLNQGSVSLNPQELRNCVYRGPLNDLLSELSELPISKSIYKNPNKRKKYQEHILRFFALRSYSDYHPAMLKYLNTYMSIFQYSGQSHINSLKTLYIDTMESIEYVLGDDACSLGVENSGDEKFSISIFDSIAIPFSLFPKEKLIKHGDQIREAIQDIQKHNIEYIDSCLANTTSRANILYRINVVHRSLLDIMGIDGSIEEERFFSNQLKELLFSQSPVCAICENKILDISHAELDHITPYSKGGPTSLKNAQLTHRHCNRHKSNKIEVYE